MFWFRKKKPAETSQPAPTPSPATPPAPATTPAPAQPLPVPLATGQPATFDEPQNDLERALLAVRNREIPAHQFLEYLMNSEVFVAVPEGQFLQQDGQMKLIVNPTIFSLTHATYSSVCFYTHPSRVKPTQDLHPDFHYAIGIQAGDLFLNINGSLGMALNPYWDVNIEWNAEQMDRLKQMLKKG